MRPHDDAVAELLREDPAFADEYLSAALDEADQPGGREALLAAEGFGCFTSLGPR